MVKLTANVVLSRTRAADLENVRKLNCWGSYITDVSIMKEIPNVQVATFSVNNITSLEAFSNCMHLEELYIRKNQIRNLSEVCHLKKLPKLRTLWLADNPCAVGERYRATVLKTLPNLHRLDNIVVQEVELDEAMTTGVHIEIKEKEVIMEGGDHKPECSKGECSTNMTLTEHEKQCTVTPINDMIGFTSAEDFNNSENVNEDVSPEQLTINEFNTIRTKLGLRPLGISKDARTKKEKRIQLRNSNILQAALCLVEELDPESLAILEDAIKNKLQSLSD